MASAREDFRGYERVHLPDQGRRAIWQLELPLFAIRSIAQKMTAKKSSLSQLKVAGGAGTTKVPAKNSFQAFRPARSN
jgi:hypothetical protein